MLERINQGASCIEMESSVWSSVAEELNLSFSEIVFFTDYIRENERYKNKSNSEIKSYTSNLGLGISKKLIKRLGGKNGN